MNKKHLEYFLCAAETLNFTKAAKQFSISQTAMTQQMKALETHLGTTLFLRNNRNVELTPAGKVFIQEATALLARESACLAKVQHAGTLPEGTLRIGYPAGLEHTVFLQHLQRFQELYPTFHLQFLRTVNGLLPTELRSHNADVIFTMGEPALDSYDIATHTLAQLPQVLVLPPDYPLKASMSYSLTQARALTDRTQLPENETPENLLLLCALGKGPLLLPYYCQSLVSSYENLHILPVTDSLLPLCVSFHKEGTSTIVKTFLHHLQIV